MAIAFDAASEGNVGSGSSLTVAHTCSGANRILWAAVFTTGNDTITGVTYNGVAMTQAVKRTTASSQTAYLYYLIAPALGTHDIVASDSGSNNLTIVGMSFTGAKQSGVPDSTNSAIGSDTLASTDLTTVADNCFAVYCCRFNTGTRSAGTGMTIAGGSLKPATGGYTTNAKHPAGTQTMSENSSASTTFGIVAASFAPSVDLAVNPTDSTTVTDTPTILITAHKPSVSDSTTLSESVSISVPTPLSPVGETITIGESVSITTVYQINTGDTVSATEDVVINKNPKELTTSDSVTVTDTPIPDVIGAIWTPQPKSASPTWTPQSKS